MKKSLKKSLLMSILTLIMALSLITGASFALFTSEVKTNIAVTSGKVDVRAVVEDVEMTSTLGQPMGQALVDRNEVVLENFVPGDKATFTLKIENKSNISVLSRTMVKVNEDDGLFEGLIVTIDGQTFNGFTAVSNWETVTTDKEVEVTIELPESTGNLYQGKSTKLAYIVEAVQGNVVKENAAANAVELYTAFDLIHFGKLVNGGRNHTGKVVYLMNDIDMMHREMRPIGSLTNASVEFGGTFDGKGYSIKNVNIVGVDEHGTGLFGSTGGQTTTVVRNFTLDGGYITGTKNVGAVYGMVYKTTIENVIVKNLTVEQTGEKRSAGLVANVLGGSVIKNNKVENVEVIGALDLGEIYSNLSADSNAENNTFTNVTLTTSLNLTVNTEEQLTTALFMDHEYINVTLGNDLTFSVRDAYIKIGGANTKKIQINGNGYLLTLTTTYWSRLNTLNPEAVIVMKNMSLTSTQETGTWNSYDVTFLSKVELHDVDVLKALALENDAVLNNVTITDTGDYYGLWIVAAGQTVDIDGLVINVPNGRGIAIKDEYHDPELVTLNIKNAEITSAKKAAIYVTSAAGANINIENVDISNVFSDTVNHVWVDTIRPDSFDIVTVNAPFTKLLKS